MATYRIETFGLFADRGEWEPRPYDTQATLEAATSLADRIYNNGPDAEYIAAVRVKDESGVVVYALPNRRSGEDDLAPYYESR